MELSGTWTFQLDPSDQGVAEQWYTHVFDQTIQLPGSLQNQGFGAEPGLDSPWTGDIRDPEWYKDPRYAPTTQPGNFKMPFWLQPERVYVGPAWYQRAVEIPAEWQGRRVTLTLERVHWGTRVWLDGDEIQPREAGLNQSLSVPHEYDLGPRLSTGRHDLTVRVDNRRLVNVGSNASSITDHSQTNWNGIVGRLELAAGSPVWVEDVQVYPNVLAKSARVVIRLGNALGQPGSARITLQAQGEGPAPAPLTVSAVVEPRGSVVEVVYPLGPQARTWDEFHPALYHLAVTVEAQVARQSLHAERTITFGLREVGVDGTNLALNGRKIFIRGTLECAIFPLTGYPPTDVESWKHILRKARSYGLNQLRFHSWCPPEAAFQAGDELGFYFQVECASWANQGACIGEGDPLDRWLYEEGRRITRAYGNHPSFLMMAYGNEPAGAIQEYLGDWVNYWKAHDPRRVYTSGAGWPAIPANQYHNVPEPRIQAWGQQLNSRINALPPETTTDYRDYVQKAQKPVVSHEIGQWCAFPNFAEIDKYTGHLHAKNFEIFRDLLNAHGMGDQAHDFLIASGKLQVLCYKEDIESALRTPGFAGFNLLDLHDFPGQGTSLVGVLDPFWEEKGYVTAQEYSRFCNATVPLARLEKRTWLDGETLRAEIEAAHFGAEALRGVSPRWALTNADGQPLASGKLAALDLPAGALTHLGHIEVPLRGVEKAARCKLVVSVGSFENDWDVWLFPAQVETTVPADVLVTHALDEAARERLRAGGKVLLLLPPEQVKTASQIGFSSVFWNTTWTGNQAPHTLGILCDPRHPLFDSFPTDSHTNWQWWELIHGAAAMQLDHLPQSVRALVQPIDTWFENRRLGLLFEAKVEGGKLMVCSMDLESDLDHRPVARQLRHSLLRYLSGKRFNPRVEVSPAAIQELVNA